MRKGMKVALTAILLLALVTPVNIPFASAAPNLTATGSNPAFCNQTVSDITNVVAYRLSGGDCVVEFKNIGNVNWTSPSSFSTLQVLVVAGGGGGAARHSGGGGGGGVIYATNYKANINATYAIVVGDGGAGAPGLSASGGGRAGNNSSFAGTSGTGSIVANGGGGGGGGGDAANALNYDGTTNVSPARGSGGGSNYDNSPVTGAGAPGSASDSARSVGSSSITVNSLVANLNAYAQSGGVGKGSGVCYGTSTSYTGWCGGGGGGASGVGAAPTQPGSVNPWKAGKGGDGVSISITGTARTFAGGGGGGSGSDVNTISTNDLCVSNSALPGDRGAGGGGAGGACLNTASSGTSNTGGGGGAAGLAYISGNSNTQGVGGKGGSGIVIIRYTPDSSAPTITNAASPFSFAENTNISTIAATIEISESSTISLDSSGDYIKFSITVVDTDTARIYFLSSPDFESLSDLDRNNDYIVYVDLTDLAGNTSTPSFTVRVTNVNEISTLGAPSISGTAYKGVAISITVTVNTPGKSRFFMDGKRISNCLSVSTTGTYPNFTATCNWKPSVTSRHALSATFTPTDNTFSSVNSASSVIWVLKRTNLR